MAKKLYVGNLDRKVTEEELETLFREHGDILSVIIVKDRASGVSKGFGFVEFDRERDAEDAKNALNGQELNGRALRVDDAKEQRERRPSTRDQSTRGQRERRPSRREQRRTRGQRERHPPRGDYGRRYRS